jgi:hypothetical protein
MTENAEGVSFDQDIKPLFRERDRDSMIRVSNFDLWSYEDVRDNAQPILDRLRSGSMPCDGAWPEAQVDLFERWTDEGMAA